MISEPSYDMLRGSSGPDLFFLQPRRQGHDLKGFRSEGDFRGLASKARVKERPPSLERRGGRQKVSGPYIGPRRHVRVSTVAYLSLRRTGAEGTEAGRAWRVRRAGALWWSTVRSIVPGFPRLPSRDLLPDTVCPRTTWSSPAGPGAALDREDFYASYEVETAAPPPSSRPARLSAAVRLRDGVYSSRKIAGLANATWPFGHRRRRSPRLPTISDFRKNTWAAAGLFVGAASGGGGAWSACNWPSAAASSPARRPAQGHELRLHAKRRGALEGRDRGAVTQADQTDAAEEPVHGSAAATSACGTQAPRRSPAVIGAAKQRLEEQARAEAEAEKQRRAEAEAERQRHARSGAARARAGRGCPRQGPMQL